VPWKLARITKANKDTKGLHYGAKDCRARAKCTSRYGISTAAVNETGTRGQAELHGLRPAGRQRKIPHRCCSARKRNRQLSWSGWNCIVKRRVLVRPAILNRASHATRAFDPVGTGPKASAYFKSIKTARSPPSEPTVCSRQRRKTPPSVYQWKSSGRETLVRCSCFSFNIRVLPEKSAHFLAERCRRDEQHRFGT